MSFRLGCGSFRWGLYLGSGTLLWSRELSLGSTAADYLAVRGCLLGSAAVLSGGDCIWILVQCFGVENYL